MSETVREVPMKARKVHMKDKITAAVITASDKGYRKERDDLSGPLLCELLKAQGSIITSYNVLPDEQEMLKEHMRALVKQGVDLIMTTGGTGLAPRDVTPEATMEVGGKIVPGIPEAMRSLSLSKSSNAMLSRAVAVIIDNTLIINMPGSPKAVAECFEFIWKPVLHALELIEGNVSECAQG